MSADVQCNNVLLLQAEFDGELDAAEATSLEAHKATCPMCRSAQSELQRSRTLMAGAPRFSAPPLLRESVVRGLRPKVDSRLLAYRAKLQHAIFGGVAGALAAGLLTFALIEPVGEQTAEILVDNHLRAMQSVKHLLDIASGEHHTVKPWFAGRIAFAPPVKDLEASGYPLRGGRIDVLAGRTVAVLVYQARQHSIDVSVTPLASAESGPSDTKLRGFNVRHWTDKDFSVWAVSDLNEAELDTFVKLWKAMP